MQTRDILLTTAAVPAYLLLRLQPSSRAPHSIFITMHRVAVILLVGAATCAMAAPVVSVPADEDFVLINAGILPVITEAEGDVVQESAAPTHTIHATAAIITAPAEWKPSFPPFASGFLDAFPDKPSILPNPNEELFWVGTTMPTSTPTPTPTHSVHGILDPFLPAVDAEPTPAPTPAHHDIIHDIFDPFLPAVDEQGHISASNEKYVVTEDTPALPILEETGSKYVVSEGMPPLKSLPPGTVRIASKED